MMRGAEHVEDRHRGVLGQLREALVGAGAKPDCDHLPREHDRGVAQRLAAAELQLVRAEHRGMAAELHDAGLEREPRARGRALEYQRHRPTLQRTRAERVRLQRLRAVEQPLELPRVELGAGEEVPWGVC